MLLSNSLVRSWQEEEENANDSRNGIDSNTQTQQQTRVKNEDEATILKEP